MISGKTTWTSPQPTTQRERIILLDSLRGIAVLGILVMNMPGFALPRVAIFNPNMLDFSGANFYTWYGVEWFLEGSQRALFSMLFGAGMLLFISRLEDKTAGLMPAEYYFRRQLWLLLFGLFNAYVLLWFWDILFSYALFGMLLFVFRRLSPKSLLAAAALCLLLQTARENVDLYRDKALISQGEALLKRDTVQTPLSALQRDRLQDYQQFKQRTGKEGKQDAMERNLREVRGSYAALYRNHSEAGFRGQTAAIFHFLFFDVLLFMFVGMAFYKNGVLTGRHPTKTYAWLCAGGLGMGLVLSYFRLQSYLHYNFDTYAYTKGVALSSYELSRAFRALGIFGGIMLLYKSGAFQWFFNLMQPVGQMAFTNYLMQSLICGILFYGVGFGLFGHLQFYQIYFVVAAVWIVEIIWSHLWLRFYKYGPLEWVWRSLTYWRKQPMRRQKRPDDVKTAAALTIVTPEARQAE